MKFMRLAPDPGRDAIGCTLAQWGQRSSSMQPVSVSTYGISSTGECDDKTIHSCYLLLNGRRSVITRRIQHGTRRGSSQSGDSRTETGSSLAGILLDLVGVTAG